MLYQALIQIEDLLALLTRRVIRRNFDVYTPGAVKDRLLSDFESLRRDLSSVLPQETRIECERKAEGYAQTGLPESLAREVGFFPELASGADIALLRTESGQDLTSCAWLYHRVGQELGLRRALSRAAGAADDGSDWWNKSALSLLRAKLVDLQYQVSLEICRKASPGAGTDDLGALLEAFKAERGGLLERVRAFDRRLTKAPAGQGVAPMVILSSMLEELT